MEVIGIDMGGSAIKAGYFENGTLRGQTRVPTLSDEGREAILRQILSCIRCLIQSHGPIQGVGLVSSGDISTDGTFLKAHNLSALEGFNLKQAIEEAFGVPAFLENDAVGALVGELYRFPKSRNLTMLTFGTGIGSASFFNGKILHGGEYDFGHMVLIPNGEPCKCGKRGCAEAYLSATALKRFASAAYGYPVKTMEFFEKCRQKEPIAHQILDDYALLLSVLLERIVSSIHPDTIILGGGVMGAMDLISPRIKPVSTRVVFSKMGNQAGMFGAAIIASKGLAK